MEQFVINFGNKYLNKLHSFSYLIKQKLLVFNFIKRLTLSSSVTMV
jgi:hypothetical protein